MITKRVYRDRIKTRKLGYAYCIVTKYYLFGFIPIYIKYEELL